MCRRDSVTLAAQSSDLLFTMAPPRLQAGAFLAIISVLVVVAPVVVGQGVYETPVAAATKAATTTACTHKVLIIMSSASVLTLQNGIQVPIGYYFDELAIPLQSFVDQGWNATFANPKGNAPVMDKRSDRPFYFAPLNPELAQRRFDSSKQLIASQPTLQNPITFAEMTNERLDEEDFDIVFVPGGHAPMVDLWNDAELGRILVHFLDAKKPISALCHGPVALLSAGLVRQPWPFAGRNLTVFSTAGEKIDEKRWGGLVQFYPAEKMAAAGGIMHIRGPAPYMPNVIRDLVANQSTVVTGQNPFSAGDVAAFQVDELLTRCGVAASS